MSNAIAATIREYVQGSDHPDLVVYRKGIGNDAKRMQTKLWRIKHWCDLGDFYGKRILEVGCGFGWDAVGMALVGRNEVIASDILPSMIDGVTQCLETMKQKGNPLPITPMQGDICSLPLKNGSLDGIFSTEAIEHVHDLQKMFDECYRLLKRGGTAVIVNDSNRFNEDARRHSWDSWQERDDSWEHVEWLKTEVRPIEHADAKPYGVMREELIREVAPKLSDEEVAKLRADTAGMIYSEIMEAVKKYRTDGSIPTRDEYAWCRNPKTGEYSERLLDPFELADMMRKSGFKVQLRHFYRKLPYRLFNRSVSKILSKRLYALRSEFILVARKPG
jgi:ubiquinone/menaquinone biosynthesis C-methylase UbiE